MRLPSWLRVTNQRRLGQHVEVTITVDPSQYVGEVLRIVEHVGHETERVSVARYRDQVELQRLIGVSHVRRLADEWAAEVGAETGAEVRRRVARERLIERQHPGHPEFIGRRP